MGKHWLLCVAAMDSVNHNSTEPRQAAARARLRAGGLLAGAVRADANAIAGSRAECWAGLPLIWAVSM